MSDRMRPFDVSTPGLRAAVRSGVRSGVRCSLRCSVRWVVLVLPVCVRAATGDEGLPLLPAPAASTMRPAFVAKGTELCVRCHRSEQSDWVDSSTTAVWRHDAHARAHLALESDNPRTRGMEEVLGIKAATTAACVACHTHPAGEPAITEETAVLHAGISCETCHGAGSGYFEPHMEKSWRFLGSAEKEAFGMHDLRNPVRKAENCLSCHLGDVASGKVVTHAMYAAGHPPLPAFDVESFGRAMGPHWKRVWEKSPQIQAQADAAGYRTETASESQRSLIAALVSLRESAAVVADYAATPDDEGRGRPWPELSLYDCQACHHELRVPSGRQEAGYDALIPGRPSLVRWPRSLARVAFAEAGQPDALDAWLRTWNESLGGRPFGTPTRLPDATALEEHATRIERAIATLAAVPRDPSGGPAGRGRIAALAAAGARCGDLESARLLGWVAITAGRESASGTADGRSAAIAALESALSLGFPTPAYPQPPATERPFWQTSLSAARDADLPRIREAFRALSAGP